MEHTEVYFQNTEPEFLNFEGFDSKESIPPAYVAWRWRAGSYLVPSPHRMFKNSSSEIMELE